jgi:hypothetical protein
MIPKSKIKAEILDNIMNATEELVHELADREAIRDLPRVTAIACGAKILTRLSVSLSKMALL